MRSQVFLVISLILMSFALFGCGNNQSAMDKSPYIGGTNGLLVSFMDSFPPDSVFDGGTDPFDIVVNLKNDGEFDIPAGGVIVRLSGIDATQFGLGEGVMKQVINSQINSKKKGSEGNTIPGDEAVAEFKGFNQVTPLTGTMAFPLRADVCYSYGTTATTNLCYRKDLRTTESGVCKVEETKKVFNSGAPVQVTDLQEFPKGADGISFTFTVALKGNGLVYKDSVQDCTDATRTDKGWVYVDVKTDLQGLTCRGLKDASGGSTGTTAGYARLADGKAIIQCDQAANVDTDFVRPLNIYLKYKYGDDVSSTLIVKHAAE